MTCLWLAQVEDAEREPLRSRVRADVCVVGGGYSGLWTSLSLAAAGASVVLVEAQRCGEGASGRNGGFALSWGSKLPSLIAVCGRAEALRLAEASTAALEGGPGFERGGWTWSATSPAQVGAWEAAVDAGAPFEPVDGGVVDRSAGTVHPARLVSELRRRALAAGVPVYERSPMVALDRDAGVVRTPGGSVRADAVVLATNAWLAAVPELRRSIAVVSSDVVATEPLARVPGLGPGECVSDSRQMVHYWRADDDGRVVLGRGGGALAYGARFASFVSPPRSRTAAVASELRQLVPATRGARVDYAWGGAVDRSVNGLPFFGVLPGRARVVYGAGFSGDGVGPCVIGGGGVGAPGARGPPGGGRGGPRGGGAPGGVPPGAR